MTKILKDKDLLILKELLDDGRKSASSISKKVDLGREIVNYRIKRLIKENLIVKFIPKINDKNYKYSEYILFLKLNLEDDNIKEHFVREKIGDRYLMWFIKGSEGWDVMVRIFVHSFDEFKDKLNEILNDFNDCLASYYTIICSEDIKEEEKKATLDRLYEKSKLNDAIEEIKQVDLTKINVDDKDIKIIEMLQCDARVKYTDIAEKIDISADSIKYRIDKLVENDILVGFYPVVNFNKIGYKQYAFILKVKNLDLKHSEQFNIFLKNNQYVIRAVKSLSTSEYFFTTIFKTDDEYIEFKNNLYKFLDNNIEYMESFFIE